jgi:hypothetical protein
MPNNYYSIRFKLGAWYEIIIKYDVVGFEKGKISEIFVINQGPYRKYTFGRYYGFPE